MSARIPFNINRKIWAKLTLFGIEILRQKHEDSRKDFPASFGEFKAPVTDEDGYSEWQLWEFMAQFGDKIYMGFDMPFEANILFEGPEK